MSTSIPQRSLPQGCNVTAMSTQPSHCMDDRNYQRAVLSIVLDFIRRPAGNASIEGMQMLAQFPIEQRFRELRDAFQADMRTYVQQTLLNKDAGLLLEHATDGATPGLPSVAQMQMYARLLVFLAYNQYRPELDPLIVSDWNEIMALVAFTTPSNAKDNLGAIRRIMLQQIPELTTLLHAMPVSQALTYKDRPSVSLADIDLTAVHSKISHMTSSPQMAVSNIQTPISTLASTPSEVTDSATRVVKITTGSLAGEIVRRDLENWAVSVYRDTVLETKHNGTVFWNAPHMRLDNVTDLYHRAHLHIGGHGQQTGEIAFPYLSSNIRLSNICMRLLSYIWTRGQAILNGKEYLEIEAVVNTATTDNFYSKIRELLAWISSRSNSDSITASDSITSRLNLQWFAVPAISLIDLDVVQLLSDIRMVMRKDEASSLKAPGLGMSLLINGYFDSWLKPLLTALCLIDSRYWGTSGGVWHSYVDQKLLFLLTNEKTLGLPLINALRARVKVLLSEREDDRELHAQNQPKIQRKAWQLLAELKEQLQLGATAQQLSDILTGAPDTTLPSTSVSRS